MTSLRKITKRLFILFNIGTGLIFLLSCCNAFLHPDKWWFIALLAFLFPMFLILLIAFILFWLFACPRYIFISLFCLLIGWQNIHAFFGLSLAGHDFSKKDSGNIRIMTWNVRSWDEFVTKKPGTSGHRLPMMDLVAKQNADILCFQEFFEPGDTAKSNIRYFQNELHYPYYFYSKDYFYEQNKSLNGIIIFSRFPITGTIQEHFLQDGEANTESVISADVLVNGKTIRVFTTHLQSVLFKRKDFRNVEIIRNAEDKMLEASTSLAKKLKHALGLRGYQADLVRKQMDSSPFPKIICGDFNDVPNSYAYFHIRGQMQDAFIAKSFGIGRSYIQISPTLRIDYILPDKQFKVVQTMKISSPYSDHLPILTDLRLLDNK